MAFQTQYEVANKSSTFPLRRVIFAYQDAGGQEQYIEDIDVQFRVHIAGNTILPNATIGVCNLDTNVMKYLTTITPFDNNHNIALYAGYEDNVSGSKKTVIPQLYSGQIRQSYFTMPPDIWLQIDSISQNVQLLSPTIAQSDIDGNSAKEYIVNVAKACGFAVVLNDKDFNQEYRRDFPDFFENVYKYEQWRIRDKTPLAMLKALVNLYNLSMTMIGGRCFIYPNSRYIKQTVEQSTADFIISKNTGMIGIPTVSNTTAEINTLFNPAILPSSTIDLRSERLQDVYVDRNRGIAANGIYKVVNIEHFGHLRGGEFITKILAVRGNY